jgi:hypothetical protein
MAGCQNKLIFKKVVKNNIESYRLISNLCSTSKLFEKLILKRILSIQECNKVDVTGIQQYGFKHAKSTTSVGLTI